MDAEQLDELLGQPKRPRMVGWFDVPVLAQTAVHMTMANVFGRHSDSRLIEALGNQPQGFFDYSRHVGEFWLDYVADLGDGWDSTHAVAEAVARPELEIARADGRRETTQAGSVLVFGGDLVYPYPSRDSYTWRAEFPYAAAMRSRATKPDLFAVPGNHDWYDSLVAFSRMFCRPERGFAGCRTQQTRSYFALRLPAKWWLVAIDLQLGSELDEPQVQYLQRCAAAMEPDARVILCVPEPQWIYGRAYPKHSTYDDHSLRGIERNILKRPVQVFLTGDLHHYRRHENAEGVQKIVSGGGGAFLHPTHAPRAAELPGGFRERAVYPTAQVSSRLAWRNLLFPWLNPRALIAPALLYALSAWFASASLRFDQIGSLGEAFGASLNAAVRDPMNGLWLLLVTGAFVFFTDTHVRSYRIIGGITHAAAHLAAAFGLSYAALRFTIGPLGLSFESVPQLLVAGALTLVSGALVGGWILGLYLLGSIQIFGRHSNEAFSSLRIEDYKQWLRLRVAPDGTLTILSMAIDRVGRYKRGAKASEPRVVDEVVISARSAT